MKPFPEKDYRALFKITVILKGLISVGEIVLGLVLAFVSYGTLRSAAFALFGGEFAETSPNLIWGFAIKGFHGFFATPQSVWVFIFLSHGIVKLVLIVALLRNKLWAYPWSAAVFTFFVVYQIYQIALAPSLALFSVTIFDAMVIALVLHEYRYRRRIMARTAAEPGMSK